MASQSGMRKPRLLRVLIGVLLVFLTAFQFLEAQVVHRNTFEGPAPQWIKSNSDAPHEETAHALSDTGASEGARCEYIQLQVKPGNFIHYQYNVGKAPILEELNGSIYLKCNRPGVQLMARVVLPAEPDPSNLDNRLVTYIRGDTYRNAGRWQRLELSRTVQAAKQQQMLMQAHFKKPIDFKGAYVDALVLNTYAGPGPTEVWIDDLQIGPLAADSPVAARPDPLGKPVAATRPTRTPVVEYNGNRLLIGGRGFFFRGINFTDTPLQALRDAGFNTLFVDVGMSKPAMQDAIDKSFWLVPKLKIFGEDGNVVDSEALARDIVRFSDTDAVLFHYLSGTLTIEQEPVVRKAIQVLRLNDPGRPQGADVWDGMLPYSHKLNFVGVHRWPLMTTLELSSYREWLDSRRRLANPGSYLWTWIQTHLPDWYTQLLYDRPSGGKFTEPIGPQSEHIRLLTYTALAAGVKGLGFWSDRFLDEDHKGGDRLLGCALLNMELDMLEPFLVSLDDPPQIIDSNVPDVKGAVMRTAKGVVVLPIWMGKGSQFVPGQSSAGKVTLRVPHVPGSMQAWEVTPADVRSLKAERKTGGTDVTLPEFGLTSIIVFTSDISVVVRLQEQARARRQLASQYSYDMGLYEFNKVLKIHEELEKLGHAPPDARALIQDTENRLRSAKTLWENRMFPEAYRESQRAMRPLRILMRAQWDEAVKPLDTPVASPYAVTFFTLPKHWELMKEKDQSVPTANLLPGGDFEIIPERTQESWRVEEPTLDDVELLAQRVGEIVGPMSTKGGLASAVELPRQGKQCAMLQIKAKGKGPVQALDRTLLALTSPEVKLPPGTLVQVSGWVRIPEPIQASVDGALFYDSAGGEPLAIRLTQPTPWKKYTLFRRIPASGSLQVTIALTGIGTVYFDDIRVEPLVPSRGGPVATPVSATKP